MAPNRRRVTPFAGVWIEIAFRAASASAAFLSLPSRECGLKSNSCGTVAFGLIVTPFAGVWIEMITFFATLSFAYVTPFAGVWIEIFCRLFLQVFLSVTPFAGVWIEIVILSNSETSSPSLPSRECGLKWGNSRLFRGKVKSLPSRECGLKWCSIAIYH